MNTETPNKDLGNSLIGNNLFQDTDDVNRRVQVAAKIGSALLEENVSFKEQNSRLETRLVSF